MFISSAILFFCCFFFFFFKQKTAYEMLRSLVGSEMCIRDRSTGDLWMAGMRWGLLLLLLHLIAGLAAPSSGSSMVRLGSGDDPEEEVKVAPGEWEVRLVRCTRKLRAQQIKALDLAKEAGVCEEQVKHAELRAESAVNKSAHHEALRAELTAEHTRAMEASKSSLELLDKEKRMKELASESCTERIHTLSSENAVMISQAKRKAEEHEKSLKDMESGMALKFEQQQAKAISDAAHAGDTQIAAAMERSAAAVSQVQQESDQQVSGVLNSMSKAKELQQAQVAEKISNKEHEYEERIATATQDKESAVSELANEKSSLTGQLQELELQLKELDSQAQAAVLSNKAAQNSLRKIKSSASALVVETKTAQYKAMSAALAGISSSQALLAPSLEPEVNSALAAAAAAHKAIESIKP
eukprot:TRINITY_DN8301_c0_g1_i3.p1 TRINITY_DN8301_c0_g1~~TRINITY_DN8301_c0_g1_i3.p1  ORF type:complete len:413 (+),score=152.85 TRINITY_DN8301_c0_g1_i3:64-1302(+)